jgi:MFS family permease
MTAVAPEASVRHPTSRSILPEQRRNTALLGIDAVAVIGLCGVALLAPSAIWLLAAFALVGVVQSSSMLARLTGPMEYAPAERRPSYIALVFGIVGPCAALAPLLGGQIVAVLGYGWLFGISAAVAVLALPFLGAGAQAPSRRAA